MCIHKEQSEKWCKVGWNGRIQGKLHGDEEGELRGNTMLGGHAYDIPHRKTTFDIQKGSCNFGEESGAASLVPSILKATASKKILYRVSGGWGMNTTQRFK